LNNLEAINLATADVERVARPSFIGAMDATARWQQQQTHHRAAA